MVQRIPSALKQLPPRFCDSGIPTEQRIMRAKSGKWDRIPGRRIKLLHGHVVLDPRNNVRWQAWRLEGGRPQSPVNCRVWNPSKRVEDYWFCFENTSFEAGYRGCWAFMICKGEEGLGKFWDQVLPNHITFYSEKCHVIMKKILHKSSKALGIKSHRDFMWFLSWYRNYASLKSKIP